MSKEKQPKDPAEQGKEIKTAADLIQDEHNYRKHSDTNKARIRKSIDEAGLGRSVVIDADGVLVAGNGVQQVIDKDTPVRVVETDGTELVVVKRTDLHTDDPRRKTLALADNATADDVEWDYDTIEADGWTEDELCEWGVDVAEWNTGKEEEKKESEEDDFDEQKDDIPRRVQKGDLWQLGQHRLFCGDSTDAGDVALLMNGERADIAFTSPPYNMAQGGSFGGYVKDYDAVVYNNYKDNLKDSEYGNLLISAATNCLNNSDDVLFNIGIVSGSKQGIIALLCGLAKNFCDILCWKKSNAIPCGLPSERGCITHFCEMIYCFNQKGTRAFSHTGDKWTNISNVIETKNASGNEYAKIHKATFPVEFAGEIISKFSEKSVLDVFGGTGTTMIAAEQLNRKCYMMELDPHYCDVIIARWEKFTGKKAEKLK